MRPMECSQRETKILGKIFDFQCLSSRKKKLHNFQFFRESVFRHYLSHLCYPTTSSGVAWLHGTPRSQLVAHQGRASSPDSILTARRRLHAQLRQQREVV